MSSAHAAKMRRLASFVFPALFKPASDSRRTFGVPFHPTPERTATSEALAGLYVGVSGTPGEVLTPNIPFVRLASTSRSGANRINRRRNSPLRE